MLAALSGGMTQSELELKGCLLAMTEERGHSDLRGQCCLGKMHLQRERSSYCLFLRFAMEAAEQL